MKKGTVILVLSVFSVLNSFAQRNESVFNSYHVEDDSIEYLIETGHYIDDGEFFIRASVIGVNQMRSEIIIPSTVNDDSDFKVTAVLNVPNYENEEIITSVIIPEGVTNIGSRAFYRMSNLKTVTLPSSVKTIGESSFEECYSLASVNMPDDLETIGKHAFYDCQSLTSIFIPKNVTSIGDDAFWGCRGLASIKVDPDNYYYDSRENCNAINESEPGIMILGCKNSTIPNGITTILNAFEYCEGLSSITIPNSVKTIGDRAFLGCRNLTSIKIPEQVETIGNDAFAGCNSIDGVTIPNSVKRIGDNAFGGITGITSVYIPSSVEYIGVNPFWGCINLESIIVSPDNPWYDSRNNCNSIIETFCDLLVTGCKNSVIPDGVYGIGKYAFSDLYNCLPSISIPESVAFIGEGAFRWCNFASVTLPSGLRDLGASAFQGTKITTITIPSGINEIKGETFADCPLSAINLPSGLTSIGSSAFSNTLFTSFVIPEGVENVGRNVFEGCGNLESITLPYSLKSVGYHLLGQNEYNHPDHVDIYVKTKNAMTYDIINSVDCYGYNNNITLYVPAIRYEEYVSFGAGYSISDIRKGLFGTAINGINYVVNSETEKTATVVYAEYEGTINIPEKVLIDNVEYRVTAIDDAAFAGCNVTSVSIPKSVTYIGQDAFAGTPWAESQQDGVLYAGDVAYGYKGNLTALEIKDGTKVIADGAFLDCQTFSSIKIPSSVTSIGKDAFNRYLRVDTLYWSSPVSPRCINRESLRCAVLGEGVTVIEDETFANCSLLDSISFPASLTYIGCNAFSSTPWYERWRYMQEDGIAYLGNVVYKYMGDMPENTSIVIPEGVTGISFDAFRGCRELVSISFPGSLKAVGAEAFAECSKLTSLIFPEGCRGYERNSYDYHYGYGGASFYNCSSLKTLVIPEGITFIGQGAFMGCESITSLSIPSTVTYIYYQNNNPYEERIDKTAFDYCRKVDTLYWNTNLSPRLAAYAFGYNLKYVELGDSVRVIEENAFGGCSNLTSLEIPAGVEKIGEGAFRECNGLKSIKVDPKNAFYDSRNECNAIIEKASNTLLSGCINTVIPHNVERIGDRAFSYCDSLTSINIPYGVKEIGNYAFSGCTSLSSITIPSSVERIGYGAFFACYGLTSLFIPASVTTIVDGAFMECISLESIIVDPGNPVYDSRDNCNAIIEKSSKTLIAGCMNSLVPDGIEAIGDEAFWACMGLTSLHLPNSVRSIGYGAFKWCNHLTEINMPSNLEYIGVEAFDNCRLTSLVIPESVTFIGAAAFADGRMLESVILPEGLQSIESYLFGNCPSLKSIIIPSGVQYIGERAFMHCERITSIVVPEGVKYIGECAFSDCDSLLSVSLPSTLSQWGNDLFHYDGLLQSIYFRYPEPERFKGGFSPFGYGFSRDECILYVPGGYYERYKANIDSYYFKDIQISDSIECGINVDGICYEITSNYHKTVRVVYGAYEGDIDIPETVMIDGVEYRVTGIGDEAFYNRKSVTSIVVPDGVNEIGAKAFYGCDNLVSLTVSKRYPDQIKIDAVDVDYVNCTLYVPGGSRYLYSGTAPWSNIRNIGIDHGITYGVRVGGIRYEIISADDKTAKVVHSLYKGDVSIPESVMIDGLEYTVADIATEAFSECQELTSIRIPKTVITLGQMTFENCMSLNKIVFEGNINISENVFISCPNIESVISVGTTPGTMDFYNPFIGGEYESISSIDNAKIKAGYDSIYNRYISRISPIRYNSGYNWECSIQTPALPAGKYDVSLGIIMGEDDLPNHFHAIIYGITDTSDVVLFDSIDVRKIGTRILKTPHYYINGVREEEIDVPPFYTTVKIDGPYDTVKIVDGLNIPDGIRGLKVAIQSSINNANVGVYSETMLLDRIFFEPIGDDMVMESYCGPFTESVFNNATLYVLEEAVDAYRNADGWKLFKNIGIDTAVKPLRKETRKIIGNEPIYDVAGRRQNVQSIDELAPGLYIIGGKSYLKR